jgi:hypothetical protein
VRLYWSIVENRRVTGGRILQRHVLYLGELNGCQEASWRRTVELFDHDESAPRQVSLFQEEHLPTTDKTTLADFLNKIETQYGKADRIRIVDRGIPPEDTLLQMRQCNPPVSYLVGTPKGRLGVLENPLLDMPWHTARCSVKVKLLPRDGETYVLAQSGDRIAKERSMRRRRLRKYLKARLNRCASGLTPRAVLEKFAADDAL